MKQSSRRLKVALWLGAAAAVVALGVMITGEGRGASPASPVPYAWDSRAEDSVARMPQAVPPPLGDPRRSRAPADETDPDEAAADYLFCELAPIERTFWCRVQAADTGAPIEGAQLSTHPPQRVPTPVPGGAVYNVQTAREGLARIQVTSPHGAVARVEAEGFGAALLSVVEGHEIPDRALVIRLSPGASLAVRIVAADTVPVDDARVEVSTPSDAITRPEIPIMSAPIVGEVKWTRNEGAGGLYELVDLSPEAPLSVQVMIDGKVVYKTPTEIVLKPGERREIDVQLGRGTDIYGQLLDQYGNPVVERGVWLTQQGLNLRPDREWMYFHGGDSNDVVARTRTDGDGRFAFEDVAPGIWWMGPSPSHKSSEEATSFIFPQQAGYTESDVAPVAMRYALNDESHPEKLVLRVHRGLFITGTVVGPNGEPGVYSHVQAHSRLGWIDADADAGSFALGPVEPIPHTVHSSGTESVGSSHVSASVEVQPGGEPIELRLRLGGTLHVRTVDARTGQGCAAGLVIARRGGTKVHTMSPHREGAELEISGLEPGIYEIAARTPDGRIGLLGGLVLEDGTVLGDLVIRLEEGARVRLRYDGSHQYAMYRILSGHSLVAADGLHSGTSKLEVVPQGTVVVHLSYFDEVLAEREITCEAGVECEASFGTE